MSGIMRGLSLAVTFGTSTLSVALWGATILAGSSVAVALAATALAIMAGMIYVTLCRQEKNQLVVEELAADLADQSSRHAEAADAAARAALRLRDAECHYRQRWG